MTCRSLWLALIILLTSASSIWAGDPQDAVACQALVDSGRPGLYMRDAEGLLKPVNGSTLRYVPDGRLFYLRRGSTPNESIWTVRSQTIAHSAKANEAMLWRPGIVTECSRGLPLETFNRNDRFVSLQRYYRHHASSSKQRRDDELSNKFHMPIRDGSGSCTGRTDNSETIGSLEDVYRFEEVEAGPLLVERITNPSTAQADEVTTIYSGLSSEIAHVAANQPTCFGFAAPLPTRSNIRTQIFGQMGGILAAWERNTVAMEQAQTWAPSKTTVILRELNGSRRGRFVVHWAEQ